MAKKEMTFEQAKEKLDGIVEKLSDGNRPIAEMVKLNEEGAGLDQQGGRGPHAVRRDSATSVLGHDLLV